MASKEILRFVRLTENAREPSRGPSKAAGLDLYSALDTTVPARERINTYGLVNKTASGLLR